MNPTDDDLNELLAPLRAVDPTRMVREANRRAALDAGGVTPWWRRSIAVPVPVAIALAASLLLAISVAWRSGEPAVAEQPTNQAVHYAVATPVAFGDAASDCHVEYSYLGSLHSAAANSPVLIPKHGGSS